MRRIMTVAILLWAWPAVGQQASELEDIRAYLRISDSLATSGQITYDQVDSIEAAGFDVLVNLAPADEERNRLEGYRVTQAGMTYVQIPVSWEEPATRDLRLFFDVMNANSDRNVFVHCFANMRVSVFVYLYRTLELGEDEAAARADLEQIWEPASQAQWEQFIERVRAEWSPAS